MTFLGNWQTSWKNKSEFPQRIDCFAIQSGPRTNSKGSKFIWIKGPSTLAGKGALFSTHGTAHTSLKMFVKLTYKLNVCYVHLSVFSLGTSDFWNFLVQPLVFQMTKLKSWGLEAWKNLPKFTQQAKFLNSHSSALLSIFWPPRSWLVEPASEMHACAREPELPALVHEMHAYATWRDGKTCTSALDRLALLSVSQQEGAENLIMETIYKEVGGVKGSPPGIVGKPEWAAAEGGSGP